MLAVWGVVYPSVSGNTLGMAMKHGVPLALLISM